MSHTLARAFAVGLCLLALGIAACGPSASAPATSPAPPAAPAAAGQPAGPAQPAAPGQAAAPAPTQPAALEPITGTQVSVAGNYLPLYVADKKGFFRAQGFDFDLLVVDSPAKLVQAIVSQSAQISWSAPDVAILAVEQGAPLVLTAAMQNQIPYSLIVQPDVHSFADVKGKTFAVSSFNSGPAILQRKILQANGIAPDDYDLVSVGGTAERFAAVRTGAAVGGMMLQPDDLRLMAEGFNRLALTTDYVPRYQWLTMVNHRDWVRAHQDQLVRALHAIQDAIRWTYDPANRDEAIALMVDTTKAPQEFAAATVDLYVNQLRIWPPDLDFEDAAMASVIEVMGELNQLPTPLPAWTRYVDRTYLQRLNAR
ncbi:MAG TPA: ABC transporter substrate-binding protein [Chloroflexota bacterium]|jgi:ABC-type nitrate/sulfonate/bicarbonate transport system substrate-binding protein